MRDIKFVLKLIKNGKAAGINGIMSENLKYLGPSSKVWLASLSHLSKIIMYYLNYGENQK